MHHGEFVEIVIEYAIDYHSDIVDRKQITL